MPAGWETAAGTSFSTAIVNAPRAAPVTLSPSASVATMIEEKSIALMPTASFSEVRSSKPASPLPATWSSWSSRSNVQLPFALTVSVNTVPNDVEPVSVVAVAVYNSNSPCEYSGGRPAVDGLML